MTPAKEEWNRKVSLAFIDRVDPGVMVMANVLVTLGVPVRVTTSIPVVLLIYKKFPSLLTHIDCAVLLYDKSVVGAPPAKGTLIMLLVKNEYKYRSDLVLSQAADI
jgi:hypothetical protein